MTPSRRRIFFPPSANNACIVVLPLAILKSSAFRSGSAPPRQKIFHERTTDEDHIMTLFAWVPGPFEMIALAVIGVLLFGRRLPDVGRSLGKTITEFKKGMKGLEDNFDDTSHAAPMTQPQHTQPAPEAIRPPQRVAATAPKFEDVPSSPPPQI
jgi:sec-independent protein translocase protein TatA